MRLKFIVNAVDEDDDGELEVRKVEDLGDENFTHMDEFEKRKEVQIEQRDERLE